MKIRDTKINLSLFGASEVVNTTAGVVNAATGEASGLSEQMQAYYSAFLIDNAEPALIYDRFAQKVTIPKGHGKTIQFRKYNPLPTLKDAIKEGVTPTGQRIDMATVNATLAQYGGYIELSDLLLMTAVDNNLVMATKLLGAQAGRTLLAGQAQGVSEILKNLALDQSEPITVYTQKEKELTVALLRAGIVSSEILITGEDGDFTLSVVTYGMVKAKKLGAVASAFFHAPMILSDRISLSKDKYCCILKRRPHYDAAFGVATRTKYGEEKSGDTHSVIKIDERKFMVALSDGMGSGEYAKRISESTMSLLESFYRAKMPSKTVLSTVNKLLTFNKEETFACVDVAIVDLDTGRADIVKIGSPSGFILSGTSLKILESATLPLGILESLHPVTATHVLNEDDVLLFLSDGITSAFGSTSDLYDALKNVSVSNPQQLADDILLSALSAYGGRAMDDMTAVAVRIFKSA